MSKQVLVVEDEVNIAESLTFILTRAGFDVTVVRDGPEALERVGALAPDVVLLDVMLPSMTGYDVLSKLRETHATADLPVVVLTAKGQDSEREAARTLGANMFVTKPYRNDEVIDAVRQLCGNDQDA